jgi:hypothetical protein
MALKPPAVLSPSPRRLSLSLSLPIKVGQALFSPSPTRAPSLPPHALSPTCVRVVGRRSSSPELEPRCLYALSSTPVLDHLDRVPSPSLLPARPIPPCQAPPCTQARTQGRRRPFYVLALQFSRNYSCIFCSTNVSKRSPKTLCSTP